MIKIKTKEWEEIMLSSRMNEIKCLYIDINIPPHYKLKYKDEEFFDRDEYIDYMEKFLINKEYSYLSINNNRYKITKRFFDSIKTEVEVIDNTIGIIKSFRKDYNLNKNICKK